MLHSVQRWQRIYISLCFARPNSDSIYIISRIQWQINLVFYDSPSSISQLENRTTQEFFLYSYGIRLEPPQWRNSVRKQDRRVKNRDPEAALLIARFRCIKARTGFCNVPIQIHIWWRRKTYYSYFYGGNCSSLVCQHFPPENYGFAAMHVCSSVPGPMLTLFWKQSTQ
jgi:hypothetical protein